MVSFVFKYISYVIVAPGHLKGKFPNSNIQFPMPLILCQTLHYARACELLNTLKCCTTTFYCI